VNREDIIVRIQQLQAQKAQSEQILRQVDANIHALAGAIQFASDLLVEEEKKAQEDPASQLIVP
jgi:hypothetical protein